ncbi:hypothetical protein FE257_009077 [Aspergillus nanangensis]|uniref:FAD-binding domain-containing protein n=1 Tax=Aspergillus nanangensis TaxID=2582783 RepID=A0AAD4GXR3_ASPNN|nr:hypothetical protein FE257_009077 [Aspergillus nanangensis]
MAPAEIAIVGGGPAGLALAALLEAKGIDYIVYERSQREAPPHGGCLDLHPGSGQRAIKEAGLFDVFKQNSRDGDATIHKLYDHTGRQIMEFGEGRDAPEIDRWALRKVLLTGIPDQKVCWSKSIQSAERDATGQVVLTFADGTTASGFKLVVGADGTFSRIRHLVTTANPAYSTKLYITTKIYPSNPFYSKMETLGGKGSMIIMGKGRHMFNSRQGDGHYRIDVGIDGPEDFTTAGIVDLSDHDAVKAWLLQDDSFGSYAPELQDIIRYSEGPFRPWIMYYMPPELLNWSAVPGVTLIGDAAHVTTPFVGDGVNCAMRDAIILSKKLSELGVTDEAIAAYEKEMFPFAIDLITRSMKSMAMFFEEDSPKAFLECMASDQRLIGTTDHV